MGVCPRQRANPIESSRVVILHDPFKDGLATAPGDRIECDPGGRAGPDEQMPANAENRIEHDPNGIR